MKTKRSLQTKQPTPDDDESYPDFMDRCMIDDDVDVCQQVWDESQGKSGKGHNIRDIDVFPSTYGPDSDESQDEFLERCTSDGYDLGDCQDLWGYELSHKPDKHKTQHKTHAGKTSGMEFVLSDETPDRMDDVIMSDGWSLDDFKNNPIALFNHNSNFPIGKWKDLRIENRALRGYLELAPKGTSERIDEIRKLIEADILRAVSVGFVPKEYHERDGSKWGSVFTKQDLIETSLVSIPANPNALAVAKSLNISRATLDMVFAGQGNKDGIKRRGINGGKANRTRNGKGGAMTLAQRISDLEVQIVAKRDQLQDHLDKLNDSNVSDADLEVSDKLNADISQLERTRDSLVASEKNLAKTSAPNGSRQMVVLDQQHDQKQTKDHKERITGPAVIINRTKDSHDLVELFIRAGTLAYAAKTWGRSLDEARARISETFPEYRDDATKLIADMVLRAASAPALTTVTGWATELAQTTYEALMPLLMPKGILTRLATRGLTLSFGAAGKIVIPTRSRTPSLAGSFVGEGLPIPVRQGAFTSQTLTPKKMAVITTWTREMDEHSIPAIEGLLRDAIQQDTTVAVDTVLLDANAATVIRPAGLLAGVSVTTATAGGGLAALIGDIKALIGALTVSTFGNVRNLVWIMNPVDMLSAGLAQAANTGIFPFASDIAGGTLAGIPIIDSSTVTAKTVLLVDAADFVVIGGGAPRMEVSDQATLHMEDTTPLELVSSPSTVAAPQRSLFQTDSLALRMIMPLNWVQRRAGTIAWTQSVTW